MISNSVTHLRSYTNSAIADIGENSAPISPVTPRDCRRRCPKRRRFHIERRRLRIERRYRRIEWRVFHDISQCFKSVSWCFTSGSRCFMMYHNALDVFHDVLWCLACRATIGVAASATVRPPIASGIVTTPQKSTMAPQGLSISPRTWSHAKLRPEWRLE